MTDVMDDDFFILLVNFIDNPIIRHPDAIGKIRVGKLLGISRKWFDRQLVDLR